MVYAVLKHLQVAIIIPYRNRSEHLKIFLRYMHPFLQRQQLYYRVFVVEQVGCYLLFLESIKFYEV